MLSLYRRKQFYHTAFTLIELLFVIAIIALLLSVVLPSGQKVKETGKAGSVDALPDDTDQPNSTEFGTEDGQGFMRAFTLLRHHQSINIVFGDGSVRRTPLTELWRQKWHTEFNMNNSLTHDDYI